MRILVVGAGAVGGYFGGMLAHSGAHEVTFVARGAHGLAIREHGLTLKTPRAEVVVRAPVLPDLASAAGFGADLILVAVKAPALVDVARGLHAALGEAGVALPLLNGLDSEEVLAEELGRSRVVGGVAQISARRVSPGCVQVDSVARLMLAPLEGEPFERVEALAAALSTPAFGCEAKTSLKRVLFTKLLWNAPFNAVCALTRKTAGEVLAVPELYALVRDAMREVAAVARAEGVPLDDAVVDATLAATLEHFSETVPSMLQDVLAGRPTETRVLQGVVVARGALHGISTPIHRALAALMLGIG